MAYDAFYDMAKAVGIRAEDISLPSLSTKGLAIAFGARGRGNALAHYEQDLEVINLTKLRGAGSLAHEWGHAEANFGLDDDGNEVFAYPRGKEREYINEKFDLLFKDLIREGIFKPYEVPAAKIETPKVESTVSYSYCEGANGQLSFF